MVSLVCLALSLPACGDDGGGEGTDTGTSATSEAPTTAPGEESGSNPTMTETDSSASVTATGDGTGATSEMTAGETEGATEGATDGETEGETRGETEGATTTGASVCEGLDREACNANEMCMPIVGRPIMRMGDGACLGEPEYLECQEATGCGDAITYACENPMAMIWEFLDTCIPMGWMECPVPPVELPPC